RIHHHHMRSPRNENSLPRRIIREIVPESLSAEDVFLFKLIVGWGRGRTSHHGTEKNCHREYHRFAHVNVLSKRTHHCNASEHEQQPTAIAGCRYEWTLMR